MDVPSFSLPPAPLVPLPGRIIKKGEPKVFFSCERTFLAWLATLTWAGSLGVGLLSLSFKRGSNKEQLISEYTFKSILATMSI